ncbi:LOW QUALITY PROTEIN: juvenile hormone esterase-like [Schistocerca cancellata]|uniref:LOW QUALITY PROTEIN: juvenile hormone esterase-like n=1 Tax=Schistocerca cancellata TaxID=274614 RepID=UPI0021180063|nr:LOW QUALITY PROTEIN: juvenile hormone esterase-like [Schistocerca cancellata]
MLLHVRNLLGIILLLRFAAKGKAEDILVTVDEGTLLGTTKTSLYNTTYTAFLGIPYAEPPLGALRFAAPQPAAGWEGVRNATEYGSDCVQEDGSGSEDCLYLNVYVPGVPEEGAQLPVMFWVHGGGYVRGGGSSREYGPDFLVSYGVILVTINYRLGAFGFLSTGDEVVPGNAGNKDQQLALTWVQRNIGSFGGDPQLVTLFGESAGAMCASFHLVSPLSAGLFSRVIIRSGNFIGHPNPLEYARWNAFRLGSILGLETNNSQELVEFLRSRDTADLVVDNSVILTDELKVLYIYEVWSPAVEPDLDGAFLTESSIQTLIDGRFHRVPIMTGVTSGELGYKMVNDTEKVEILNNEFVKSVAPCLHLATAQQQQEAALKMRDFYFGNGTVSVDNPDPVVDFNNDMMFFEPADALVRKVSELSDTPVFYYEFDYRGKIVQSTNWGVNHAGDIFVLFVRDDTVCNLDPESEEDQVRRNMVRYWTNFAKYGNPTPEADPVIWEPYNNVTRSYMLMQSNFSLAHNKDAERMDFWHENVPLQPYADNFWRHV